MNGNWKKLMVWANVLMIGGMLLAACSAAPTAQELSGSTTGGTAVENLPVTGETAAPTETAAPLPAATDTLEPAATSTAEPVVEATSAPTGTPQPTATSRPLPPANTPQPAQDNGKFSLTSANGVSPDDIIQEMTVAVEGKGDGPCFDKNEQIFLNSNERFLMEAVYVSICGWDKNDDITFTVTDPQGKVRSVTEKPEERNGQIMFRARYQPRLGDPAGNYHFVVESGSARLEWDVTYNAPSGPHLYIVSDNRFRPLINTNTGSYKLRFAGFQPNEKVRLFAYKVNGKDSSDNETRELVGWQDYRMDDNGNLTIESDAKNMAFLAYGKQSGEVHLFTLKRGGGDLWDWFGSRDYYCPGAPQPKLNLNDEAAPTVDLDAVDNPGSGNVTFTLPAGTQVFPQAGPRCADGAYWWQIFDPNSGNPGWVPETQDGDVVLKK